MKTEQLDLILQAKDSHLAARLLLDNGFSGFAASRAYYSMFYVAQAFLLEQELAYSSHSATIAAFGKEFCHGGNVPPEYHKFLRIAFDFRHKGDYGKRGRVSTDVAQTQIDRAGEFLRLAEDTWGQVRDDAEE